VDQKTNSESRAGRSTREMAANRRKSRKELGLSALVSVVCVSLGFLYYLNFGHPNVILVIGGLVLFVFLMRKVDRTIIPMMDELHYCERRAAKGANAEEKIGALLDQLSPNYVVWHDVNTDGGNIDHVAFRKDGAVFLIETKSHHGKITQQGGQLRRNGQPLEKDFIGQTHKNIFRLKEFLKARWGFEPWVPAVIVFSNGHVEKHLKIKEVAVINVSFLTHWIQRQPGNSRAAARLLPKIEKLKAFPASVPNRLAPPPVLR
jgi:hypothetical protein